MIPQPNELDLVDGLIQVEGVGNNLKSTHNPTTGWKLNFPNPPIKDLSSPKYLSPDS